MSTLRVASVQFPLIDNDFTGNMQRAEKMVKQVMKESNVDLLLFPEVCIEGVDKASFETLLTVEQLDEIDKFWRSMAKMSGIHILPGHIARRDGVWLNLATCYAPDGSVLAEYAKAHLFNTERGFFKPGDKKVIFKIRDFSIGIMICADLGFPEFSRTMAVEGVDVLAVPSCWGYPHDLLWVLCNQLRAAENSCYLVSCNRFGKEISGRVALGHSMATSPRGEIIANLGLQKEGYFVATLHKSEVELERSEIKWLEWLRPELYDTHK
ncbi:MAG TPA: carbon-nitrogen hydrolase family protein [Firmicutes bacterium]|jgi:predicted amidohydrolase|nr:carbon-nitrogen hydrolase family protein [Bacillota bacterium]